MSSTGISTVSFKGILKISAMGLLVFGLMGFKSLGDDKTLCAGFLPANNMRIPVGMMTAGGITQQQFDAVLNRVENLYKADIARLGGTLKINHLWTDATVNASATRQGNVWVLNMYGGLARHPATSEEGMALVACHEMGHHLGGAPKISGWFSTWATNEGGADYYAGLKCLRKYFAQDDNKAALANVTLDPGVVETCTKQFTTEADQLICERISLSGDSVAYLFQALRNEPSPPKYTTPDHSVVTKMNDDHPATQCRMDTYFAGMTCAASVNEANSDTDYHTGACSSPHDTVGVRPLCWFYPGR